MRDKKDLFAVDAPLRNIFSNYDIYNYIIQIFNWKKHETFINYSLTTR